jgi:restriction system protein
MADHFSLSDDEREALLPSGKAPKILSRTGWALTYLKQAGLVRSPRRGLYELTDRGRETLEANPQRIDNDFLVRFPEFRDFRARSRSTSGSLAAETPADSHADPLPAAAVPPDEALEAAYQTLRSTVEAELLETLKQGSPAFFERVVIDLLVKMGYGGSREGSGRAIGRSGDGGIDGVIDEDRLGLDVIYVQAKRWESSVGRPEVQRFAGALQGRRAKKGVLITTSYFTRDAHEYAGHIESRIVLIDGKRLTALMFDFDVGVSANSRYVVKSVDGDYFDA